MNHKKYCHLISKVLVRSYSTQYLEVHISLAYCLLLYNVKAEYMDACWLATH